MTRRPRGGLPRSTPRPRPGAREPLALGRIALLALVGCALLLVLAGTVLAGTVKAATPGPSPATGDTRSSGVGAGFVGQPILAAVGIVALGGLTAGAAVLYVRATRRP